jgi:tetratricopeptide (TPR) repeat protein
MPGDAEAQRFKEAFERGEAHFAAGDYGAAIAAFRAAERARATPEVAYDLAKCHEKLQDDAYAVYYYRLYLRRAPNAPDTLEVAGWVGETLATIEAEGLGYLELDAPRADLVTVAGRRFPEPPVALFLPPGEYEVTASFPGGTKTMSVQLRTGKTTSVTFEPMAPPLLPVERALPEELLARGELEPRRGPSLTRVSAYAVLGVGLAALATGIALGAASAGDAARAGDRRLSVSEAQDFAEAANGKALGANVLFGVGGAALAGGALLFVFSLPEPGMKPQGATP